MLESYREVLHSLKAGPYEIMDGFAVRLKDLMNVEEIFIFLLERHRGILRLVGTSIHGSELYKDRLKLRLSEIQWQENTACSEATKLDDVTSLAEALKDPGLNVYLIPVCMEDELIGAVGVATFKDLEDIPRNPEIFSEIGAALKLIIDLSSMTEMKRKLETLELLSVVHSQVTEPRFLLDATLKLAMDTLNAEVGSIWILHGDELKLEVLKGLERAKVKKETVPVGHGLVGLVAQKRDPVLSVSANMDERLALDIFDMEIKSAVGAPIDDGEQILGVIMLVNRQEQTSYRPYKHFDEFDMMLLSDIGMRLGVVINRAELYHRLEEEIQNLREVKKQREELIQRLQKQLNRLRILQKISQAMRSSYDINNAYKILLLGITSGRGLGYNRALLLVRDRQQHVLRPKYWVGPSEDERVSEEWQAANERALRYSDFRQYLKEEALIINLERGLIDSIKDKVIPYRGNQVLERVVLRRKLVHVTEELVDSRHEDYEILANVLQTKEFVICPLSGRFETMGVLVVDNKYNGEPFLEDDLEILNLLGDSAGLTIEAIESYEELKTKTQTLERQKDLVEYLRRFAESILQNLDAAIIVIDRENRVREWNRKAEIIFGRQRERMVGKILEEISPELAELQEVANKVYEIEETIDFSEYYMKLGKRELYLDIRFSPLRNPTLNIIEGVIISVEDVTKRRELEMELKKQERLTILGEMAARVAHELKNPIVVIGGFVKRLEKKLEDPETARNYLSILKDEAKRLEGIVGEILEFSREKRRLEFEPVDLGELIRDVLELYSDKIKHKGIKLKTTGLANGVVVNVDRSRIKQVVINLIQNAIEACDVSGFIEVEVGIEGNSAFFKVWNDGEPIPKDTIDKIFMPFFTTKTYGTGLGLPICKKIVEDEHGGRILVESNEDGTTFTVIIPVNPVRKGE